MRHYEITRTQYKVADFVSWMKAEELDLTPPFQRRSVWKQGAKSFLLDTVVRGLPTPIIFLRDQIDLKTLTNVREVVDGQQRLRTVLAYVSPDSLPGYDPARDAITMSSTHNPELANIPFAKLDSDNKHRLLNYEFSVHVLPSSVDDREVLMIFSRLNSTGVQLNRQELRNAKWFGEFKTLMYLLALEQLDRWRGWRVLDDEAISRMKEAEITSDFALMMVNGYGGKSQPALDDAYERYDEEFPQGDVVARRFRRVLDVLDEIVGDRIAETPLRTENWFIPLFFVVYRALWGNTPVTRDIPPKRLPASLAGRVLAAGETIGAGDLPQEVQDATRGAATDKARRETRLRYLSGLIAG